MLPTLSLVSFLPLVRSHFTIPRSRASSIPPILFVLLPSPLCVQHRSTLFSPPVQSCSPRCLIPYTVVQPSDVSRDTFTLSFSFSLSLSLSLSLPLFSFFLRFFSNLYSFLPLRSFLLVHSSLPLPFFHTFMLSSEPAVFLMISLARVYPLFPSFLDSSLFLYLSLSSLRLVSLRSARISLDRKHHVIHDFLQFVIFSSIFLIISVQQLSS